MEWLESATGPLILLPEPLLPYWDGADEPSGGRVVFAPPATAEDADADRPATDYDRACGVRDLAALLDVGPGVGLVLGNQPYPATCLEVDGQRGVLIARWVYGASDAEVDEHLARLPDEVFERGDLALNVPESPLILFDASISGRSIDADTERIVLELPAGQYRLRTTALEPDEETSLVLHWLGYVAP